MSTDWPESKLHNPWNPKRDCYIEYDEERKLLTVVDAETIDIIHVFNPLDIIGVDVEIKLFEAPPPAADVFCNIISTEGRTSPVLGDEKENNDGDDNIFDVVTKNTDSIFNVTDNNLLAANSQAAAILNIYTYPKIVHSPGWLWGSYRKSSAAGPTGGFDKYEEGTGHRAPHHYSFPVAASHDFEAVSALVRSIRHVAQLVTTRRHKCLVLINPKSGTGRAPLIWKDTVKPMLEEEAGMDCCTVVETDHTNHAKEYMEDCKDLLDYDAVIFLGGDGILYEVLQGWKIREDFEQVLTKIKIGILGCGTCNGLAKSVTFEAGEECGIVESTFLIARGKTLKMDLGRYETSLGNTYLSFLTFTWAMIADIDLNSEVLRCLGEVRLDIWGALCVASLHRYKGRLSYLPPNKNKEVALPPLTDPVPSDWKVIEDDILLLWTSNVSHAGMHQHSSPPSKLEDGVFQIMLVRGNHVGRIAMASILLSLDSGKHVQHPNVEFVECVAYRLEPLSEGSHNDLDGELLESGPIQAKVLPGALQIFSNTAKTKE